VAIIVMLALRNCWGIPLMPLFADVSVTTAVPTKVDILRIQMNPDFGCRIIISNSRSQIKEIEYRIPSRSSISSAKGHYQSNFLSPNNGKTYQKSLGKVNYPNSCRL
jgi:hypothetical protein